MHTINRIKIIVYANTFIGQDGSKTESGETSVFFSFSSDNLHVLKNLLLIFDFSYSSLVILTQKSEIVL